VPVDPADLTGFSGRVPIFPLPNVVFFPRTLLPLHIFEERYRAMTRDALTGERLIAMAMLKPGWEPNYERTPEIFTTVGLGRIVQEQRLPDGRYNIVLLGLQRARVVDEQAGHAYRMGRLELLEESAPERGSFEQIRLGLLAVHVTLMRARNSDWKPDPHMSLGLLCDLLAAQIDGDPLARQAVFEELDVAARARRVVEMLQSSAVASKEMRSGLKEQRKWPADPSNN